MFSSPLHTYVHCILRITDPSSCLHVHYFVHGEMYIGIDSRLIDLSLCCIICFQIKKIRVLVAKPELLISCHHNEWQSAACFPSRPPRQHRVAWETPKWADNLAGGPAQRHKKVAVSTHEKSRCRGDFVQFTLCSVLCRFVFSSLQIHVQFFADSCSVICRFMFSFRYHLSHAFSFPYTTVHGCTRYPEDLTMNLC